MTLTWVENMYIICKFCVNIKLSKRYFCLKTFKFFGGTFGNDFYGISGCGWFSCDV